MADDPPARHAVLLPAYGTVRSLLLVGVLVVVVDRATGVLVRTLAAAAPQVPPSRPRTAMAVLLWVVLGLVVVREAYRQSRARTPTFESDRDLAAYLLDRTPGRHETGRWLAVVAVGAALALAGVGELLDTVEFLLLAARRMAAGTTVGTLDPGTVVLALAALAGCVLGAHAVDRLVVGGVRAFQHRRVR